MNVLISAKKQLKLGTSPENHRVIGRTSRGYIFHGGSDGSLIIHDEDLEHPFTHKIELINGMQCGMAFGEFIIVGIWGPDII
jgi:hypothetical protein